VTEQQERTLNALVKLRDAIAAGSHADRRRWVEVQAKMTGPGAAGLAMCVALGRVVEAVDVETRGQS
jgi:roadblock/LC7 domain-containing protein